MRTEFMDLFRFFMATQILNYVNVLLGYKFSHKLQSLRATLIFPIAVYSSNLGKWKTIDDER